ncbi:MAG: hypothetical protein WCF18_09090 [Chthoniobacteraceae bacterium]
MLIFAALFASALGYFGYSIFAPTGPIHRKTVEEFMQETGGLAPFPRSARSVRVFTPFLRFGSSATFSAPLPDIKEWIRQSPRMRGVIAEPIDGTSRTRYFHRDDRDGVLWTELVVDESNQSVHVFVQGHAL